MAHRLERLSPRVRWAASGGLVCALALALWAGLAARPRDAALGPERTLILAPRPFAATVTLAGSIKAGAPTDVVAPFDGAVSRLDFTYGDPVAVGQSLLILDTFDLAQRAREARTAYLKALDAAREMRAWGASPEVSRARRADRSAELDLADIRRKLDETQALLARGLVPRSEYDALNQQLRSQQINAAATREDLAAALRRGEGPNREIVALDLEAARARLEDLEAQRRGANIIAPVAGVLIRPPAANGAEADLHVGQRLSRGQLIGSIAGADGLVVELALDEADATRVRPGQAATVTASSLNGLSLPGQVVSVAGEARPAASGAGSATVLARVRLAPLPPSARGLVRIGMTVEVAIVVHEAAGALVIPPQAVAGAPPLGQVTVRERSGHETKRAVRLGYATPDGVEVLAGLRPGEILVWRDAP